MKKYLAVLLAAVCLLTLTACGGGAKGEIQEGFYYEATGISPDAILMTINGEDVPAERYFYWLLYNCNYTVEQLETVDWAEIRTFDPPVVEEPAADAAPSTEEPPASTEEPAADAAPSTEEPAPSAEETPPSYEGMTEKERAKAEKEAKKAAEKAAKEAKKAAEKAAKEAEKAAKKAAKEAEKAAKEAEKAAEKAAKEREKAKIEQTLDEYVKQMALENTALYTIVEQMATLHAVELTAEDRTAIAQEYQNNCDAAGGEEAYLASLAELGVSRELAESYSQDYYLYQRLFEFSQEPESPLAPDPEALAAFTAKQKLCTVDYIVVSTQGITDPVELATRRERAEMVLAQLNAKTNPPADFYMVMEAYSDRKDFPSGGITFAPGESGLGEALEEAASKLAVFEYSDRVLEGPDGYYILRGREVDPALLARLYFDQTLSDAVTTADIATKRPYKKLSAETFYNNMTQLKETGTLAPEEEEK